MCAPGVYLSEKERVELSYQDKLLIEYFTDEREKVHIVHTNETYGTSQMNMRRIERLRPAMLTLHNTIVEKAMGYAKDEKPTKDSYFWAGVFPQINGIWERSAPRDPIFIPDGYRVAGLSREGKGFLITVGEDWVERTPHTAQSAQYYEHVFKNHGRIPRAPLIIKSKIKPIHHI